VGDRGEHLRGDLIQSVEQEVHRPVGLIVGELDEPLDRHPLGDPPGRGQLRTRLQRALRNECEQHPLDGHPVVAAPGGDLS
jgi:hypothetical protein